MTETAGRITSSTSRNRGGAVLGISIAIMNTRWDVPGCGTGKHRPLVDWSDWPDCRAVRPASSARTRHRGPEMAWPERGGPASDLHQITPELHPRGICGML